MMPRPFSKGHALLPAALLSVTLFTLPALGQSVEASASVSGTGSASADPVEARPVIGFAALDRPTGIAEVGFGWLTLPGAEVCTTGCARGDTSFQLDVWQIFRLDKRFAFGAGILLALIPTNAGPEVDHDRRYMTVEGTARYYPYVGENVEWWVGVTGGLVVVSDRFFVSDDPSDRALLGPRGQTLRTEGGSFGLAGGPVVALARHWALGATLHYGQWVLPIQPAVDSRGNHASLAGRNTVVSLGVNLAFRLAL
jgi:hypothetical protein